MGAINPYIGGEFDARIEEARVEWVAKARCLTHDPDDLFVRRGGAAESDRYLPGVSVVAECLADALDNHMEFGIWGGLTERQRRALLKQHPEVASWSDYFAARRKRRGTGKPA